jgi:hypothetical protein
MSKFSPLLFVIVMSTSLLAQSTPADSVLLDRANLDKKSTTDIITDTKYCANVEEYSDSQVPRIFAQTTSVYGQSAGWVEYDTRAAWKQVGSPKPVAVVWYRDAKIVRVAISLSDDENPRVYADYCYRKDGSLARLRSVPSVERKCQPNRYQCTLVLREERLYLPEGQALTIYGDIPLRVGMGPQINEDGGLNPERLSAGAERIVETFVPMKWPEYRHVTDLPFSELL